MKGRDVWTEAANRAAKRIAFYVLDLAEGDECIGSSDLAVWSSKVIVEEFAEVRREVDRVTPEDAEKAGLGAEGLSGFSGIRALIEGLDEREREAFLRVIDEFIGRKMDSDPKVVYCDSDHDHSRYKCLADPDWPRHAVWVNGGAHCTTDHDHVKHGCASKDSMYRYGIYADSFLFREREPSLSLSDLQRAVDRAARTSRGDGMVALRRLAMELMDMVKGGKGHRR